MGWRWRRRPPRRAASPGRLRRSGDAKLILWAVAVVQADRARGPRHLGVVDQDGAGQAHALSRLHLQPDLLLPASADRRQLDFVRPLATTGRHAEPALALGVSVDLGALWPGRRRRRAPRGQRKPRQAETTAPPHQKITVAQIRATDSALRPRTIWRAPLRAGRVLDADRHLDLRPGQRAPQARLDLNGRKVTANPLASAARPSTVASLGYAARSATTSTGTASLKLDSDPLGSPFLNDSADAVARTPRG